MQEIATEVVEGRDERYQFTWPNKREAILVANAPLSKTLRPAREESVNFDETENLYIEGDNLEVLKLLQETYLGKIKMIYIDPPYNTGNNLIYKNDFSTFHNEYTPSSGQNDEEGNQLVQNLETNGRFHTDWLNMIYPRLLLSRNLLSVEGYIAVAIDDNELYNLKKIMDEIFGERNYIGTIVTRSNPQGRNKNNIDPVHEYHLLYSKDISSLSLLKIENHSIGKNEFRNLMRSGTNSRKHERPYRFYPILEKDGKIEVIEKSEYTKIYSKTKGFDYEHLKQLEIKYENLGYRFILPIAKNGEEKVWQRVYERVAEECNSYVFEKGQVKIPVDTERTPISLWNEDRYSNVSNGTNRLKAIFDGNSYFDFSKSLYTIMDLVSLNTNKDDIILDFFSGSGTSAESILRINLKDGETRRFIMVQLPEATDEKSEAYKAGYKTICDIGKERIRRAGQKILEENKDKENIKDLDIGFRVLKTDSSNMKDVYYAPDMTEQGFLDSLENNIKEDRSPEDLLFQVMLDLGIPLSAGIQVETMGGKNVFVVEEGFLIACFDGDMGEDVVKAIAEKQPYYAVFRDASMAGDSVATNFDQIFESISSETVRRVL
ncbi:site-specific DNA-methyltransferase [Aedoeadaptatus nemausensis]|nr:site-specific DNA-methyltransferase [Peptoniphilus nemausensis]